MIPPRGRKAHLDRRIYGSAFAVYHYLCEEEVINPADYSRVKADSVATAMGIGEPTVKWALRRLVATGYITRGAKDGRMWTYRLVWPADARKAG